MPNPKCSSSGQEPEKSIYDSPENRKKRKSQLRCCRFGMNAKWIFSTRKRDKFGSHRLHLFCSQVTCGKLFWGQSIICARHAVIYFACCCPSDNKILAQALISHVHVPHLHLPSIRLTSHVSSTRTPELFSSSKFYMIVKNFSPLLLLAPWRVNPLKLVMMKQVPVRLVLLPSPHPCADWIAVFSADKRYLHETLQAILLDIAARYLLTERFLSKSLKHRQWIATNGYGNYRRNVSPRYIVIYCCSLFCAPVYVYIYNSTATMHSARLDKNSNRFIKNWNFHYRFLDHRVHPYWRIQSTKPDGISNTSWENVCIGLTSKNGGIMYSHVFHLPPHMQNHYCDEIEPSPKKKMHCIWTKTHLNVFSDSHMHAVNLALINQFIIHEFHDNRKKTHVFPTQTSR